MLYLVFTRSMRQDKCANLLHQVQQRYQETSLNFPVGGFFEDPIYIHQNNSNTATVMCLVKLANANIRYIVFNEGRDLYSFLIFTSSAQISCPKLRLEWWEGLSLNPDELIQIGQFFERNLSTYINLLHILSDESSYVWFSNKASIDEVKKVIKEFQTQYEYNRGFWSFRWHISVSLIDAFFEAISNNKLPPKAKIEFVLPEDTGEDDLKSLAATVWTFVWQIDKEYDISFRFICNWDILDRRTMFREEYNTFWVEEIALFKQIKIELLSP